MPASDPLRDDVRRFLTGRRARLTPQQAGLPDIGGHRRVAGLRRSEVAQLANISVEYYTRLERGNVRGVSAEVLDALARALQFDDVERAHLDALVRAANAPRHAPTEARPRDGGRTHLRAGVLQVLDAMTEAAAFVRDARLDVLAANPLARVLYADAFDTPARPVNLARFVFLDPRARRFYRDWDAIAHDAVGSLRTETARTPGDTVLAGLVDDLTARSAGFRRRWDAHDVEYYRSGRQLFHHPRHGDLDLDYDALEIPADPGLTIVAYTLPAGGPHAGAFERLRRDAASEDTAT
ncbi:helix-turn-helix domain-containing protein [Actinomadura violacea]|uniref:Helix-turn-helix domain-containing protein n=1 Tax=Actinomadura violacea TaxID=2819934 RepID=A0ABS3RQM8_9ACTN|nr:helix-turn-helix transcriptional regulator [Actinomadura violacea]MBO2458364.1 helix-turn-helix domain-containing protein [Actinomadura violacea]